MDEIQEQPPPKKINKTDDKQYFNKYYHEHLAQKVECELCNCLVSKAKLKRHQTTNKCKNKCMATTTSNKPPTFYVLKLEPKIDADENGSRFTLEGVFRDS